MAACGGGGKDASLTIEYEVEALEAVPAVDPSDAFGPKWETLPDAVSPQEEAALRTESENASPGEEVCDKLNPSNYPEFLVDPRSVHPKGTGATAKELIQLGTDFCIEATDAFMATISDNKPGTWDKLGLHQFYRDDYNEQIMAAAGSVQVEGRTLESEVAAYWAAEYAPAKMMAPEHAAAFKNPRLEYPKREKIVQRQRDNYEKDLAGAEEAMNKAADAQRELAIAEADLALAEADIQPAKDTAAAAEAHTEAMTQARADGMARQAVVQKQVTVAKQAASKAKQAATKAKQAAAQAAKKADPGQEALEAKHAADEEAHVQLSQELHEMEEMLAQVKQEVKDSAAAMSEARKAANEAKKVVQTLERTAAPLRAALKVIPRKIKTFEDKVEKLEGVVQMWQSNVGKAVQDFKDYREQSEATLARREREEAEVMAKFTAGKAIVDAFDCSKYLDDVRRAFHYAQLEERRKCIDDVAGPEIYEFTWKTEDNKGYAKHGAKRWEAIQRNDARKRRAAIARQDAMRKAARELKEALRGM